MKTILVVATYRAYVPEDMTVTQVQELVEEELRNNADGFRIYVEDYPDEDNQEPLFDLEDVMCGTELMISIGGE